MTGVQTCALPISLSRPPSVLPRSSLAPPSPSLSPPSLVLPRSSLAPPSLLPLSLLPLSSLSRPPSLLPLSSLSRPPSLLSLSSLSPLSRSPPSLLLGFFLTPPSLLRTRLEEARFEEVGLKNMAGIFGINPAFVIFVGFFDPSIELCRK